MTPPGHGITPSGSAAVCSATSMIHPVASPAGRTSNWASPMCRGATNATAKPSRVAGATAGPASRLAGIATGASCPDIRTRTGVTATWAAAATAVASANHRGIRAESRSRQPGARTRMPAVAETDRAKP